jgi:hypothetical protein
MPGNNRSAAGSTSSSSSTGAHANVEALIRTLGSSRTCTLLGCGGSAETNVKLHRQLYTRYQGSPRRTSGSYLGIAQGAQTGSPSKIHALISQGRYFLRHGVTLSKRECPVAAFVFFGLLALCPFFRQTTGPLPSFIRLEFLTLGV